MSIASSQVSKTVPKKFTGTIQGDGSTLSFTVAHNLDSEDFIFCAREIEDGLKEVFLDNYPDPADPKNKLIISFEFAPTALQSYKILIVG